MSEFIEATSGVFIRKEDIEAVIVNSDGTTTIYTEGGNKFPIRADAMAIVSVLDEEAKKEEEVEAITSQYFGG